MKLQIRYIPSSVFPHENISAITQVQAKLYQECPCLAFLPKIAPDENLLTRTLCNIPNLINKQNQIYFVQSEQYKNDFLKIEQDYNNSANINFEKYKGEDVFLDKFCSLLDKFQPPHACVNLLGPFSAAQYIKHLETPKLTIADKHFRKFLIQSIALKALYYIDLIKAHSPQTTPIIVIEEPLLVQFSLLSKMNEAITSELIVRMLSNVVSKIKEHGAYAVIQSMEKCDWRVPISSNPDMISFGAYKNPNNLNIIPKIISDFILKGGKINWAIVPTDNENCVKSIQQDKLLKYLETTFNNLIDNGVPTKYVYNSSTVSTFGSVEKLPIIQAEKAMLLATQLSEKIPVVG